MNEDLGILLETDGRWMLRFERRWVGETVRFEITPDAEGSRLRFTHVFAPDRAQAPRNAAGWLFCLEALGSAIAGAPGRSPARQKELTDRYVIAIGDGPTAAT